MKNDENEYTQLEPLQKFEFAKTSHLAGIVHTVEMIAIRPCVENLGLNWSGALQAIKRDNKLSQLCVPVKAMANDGKMRDMICLPPAQYQEWLWSLSSQSLNFNVGLWEQYKKGLVLHLMLMLKISLNEIMRLRNIERLYNDQKIYLGKFLSNQSKAEEIRLNMAQLRKEKGSIVIGLKDIYEKDPNQLSVFD